MSCIGHWGSERSSSHLHVHLTFSRFLACWVGGWGRGCHLHICSGLGQGDLLCLSRPISKNWSQQIGFYLWFMYILVLAEFIAECTRKRSLTSVRWKAVTRLSRHLQSCHVMRSGTQGKSLTNAINVTKPLSAMTISNDIIVFTQVRHAHTVFTCTVSSMLLYIFRKILKSTWTKVFHLKPIIALLIKSSSSLTSLTIQPSKLKWLTVCNNSADSLWL